MKNRLIKIFSCVFFVLFIGAVVAGLLLVIRFKRIEKEEYAIMVSDSVTVYAGEQYVLNPYLTGEDGRILESRFDFTTDSEGLSVTPGGIITAASDPVGDATVTVFEKNTGLSTTVYVHVVDKLDYVKGIVFADNGTQYEVNSSSEFTLEYGKTYSIKFVTEPQNVKIEDYCTVLTDKADGIFDLTYDGNIVYMKAIGLGAGVQCVEVINDLNAKLFEMKFDFVINMRHNALGDDVLKSLDKELISGKQIESAESLTISLDAFDLNDLNDFKSLNTLVFAANSLVSCKNIRDDLCYRIKANLLEDYNSSILWKQYIDYVIPYEGDNLTDRFIVLHNEKPTTDCPALTYVKVAQNTVLPVYGFIGFTNTGWQKSDGSLFTDENINSVKVGVHIYAVWSNIEFNIKFHVLGDGDTDFVCVKEQKWVYGDNDYLIDFDNLEKNKKGYLFEKWHDEVKEKDYGDAESCLKLDVSGNNPEINLYCIWRPIKYIVNLSSSVEGTKIKDENDDDVDSLKLMYDVEYTLPEAECTGYTFVCWKVFGEDVTYGRQVINLCEHEDDSISLEAQFTENEYNLYIFTSDNEDNKAYIKDDGGITYITEFEPVKLKYTEVFDLSDLPVLYNDAYDTYNWKYGIDQEYAVDAKISKLTSENNGYAQIFAVWTNAHAYTITYNLNGGTSPVDGTTKLSDSSFRYENASYPKEAHKFGSEFLGWDYNGKTYSTSSAVTGKGLNLNRFSDTVVFIAKWREEAGTQQDPYCISSKYLLKELADKVNGGNNFTGKYLKVTNDIKDVGEFTPIGNNNGDTYYSVATAAVNRRFAGTFDGGNKTISDYSVTAKSGTKGDTYAGLFGYIAAEGTVQNLNVSGITIDGKSTRSSGSKGGSHHGGIAGVCSGKILSCTVNGSVSGGATLDTHHGGIVGYVFLKGTVISDCKNNAVVDGTAGRCNSHGGIVGSVNNGVVYNCQNGGTIKGTNGGTGSYSNGVKGYAFFGGIAGVACAVIVNCNNTATNNVAGGGWSFNGTANSGSGAIVGYLHNGSDANTDSTGDNTLTIDKTQYGGYYSAVVNCGAKNTLIGFVQNDTGNNKKPVALHLNTTIATAGGYRSLSGNAPTAIVATYYDNYLSSTVAVNEMFKTSALMVPAAYIMTSENSTNGATHVWDDHVDLPQDATAYIILGVGSALGIAGLVILTVALIKLKKKRDRNES